MFARQRRFVTDRWTYYVESLTTLARPHESCVRWSRGVYRPSKRPSEPCVVDSRGQAVRSLEMAQTFLTDAEVDELVTVYEGRLLAAFEGVLRAGMVIANVSLITLS